MSGLEEDRSWREAARGVARELDQNHVQAAQNLMRQDLWQLQNDPRGQQEFIKMVNRNDHKGIGSDLNINRGPNGEEMWEIVPADYGRKGRYPVPVSGPPAPEVVVVRAPEPSAGERFVDGLVTGVGVGIGIGIMDKIFGGHDRHRYRHRR